MPSKRVVNQADKTSGFSTALMEASSFSYIESLPFLLSTSQEKNIPRWPIRSWRYSLLQRCFAAAPQRHRTAHVVCLSIRHGRSHGDPRGCSVYTTKQVWSFT